MLRLLRSYGIPLFLLCAALLIIASDSDQVIFLFLNGEVLRLLPDMFWEVSTFMGNGLFVALTLSALLFRSSAGLLTAALVISAPLTLIIQGLKHALFWPRPALVLGQENVYSIGQLLWHYSFPSGHTATVFFLFLIATWGIRHRVVCCLAVVAASVGGLARVAVGAHFLSDVLCGAAIAWTVVQLLTPPTTRFFERFPHDKLQNYCGICVLLIATFGLCGGYQFTIPGYYGVQIGVSVLVIVQVVLVFVQRRRTATPVPTERNKKKGRSKEQG